MGFELGILIPILAITLGCAIPIVAIIVEHFTEKEKLRVMQKAIENGIAPDDLSLVKKKGPRMPYRAGMIFLAVGIGIAIFAVLIGRTDADDLYPILGLASIPVLIGIAMIVNDRINYDRLFKNKSGEQ